MFNKIRGVFIFIFAAAVYDREAMEAYLGVRARGKGARRQEYRIEASSLGKKVA